MQQQSFHQKWSWRSCSNVLQCLNTARGIARTFLIGLAICHPFYFIKSRTSVSMFFSDFPIVGIKYETFDFVPGSLNPRLTFWRSTFQRQRSKSTNQIWKHLGRFQKISNKHRAISAFLNHQNFGSQIFATEMSHVLQPDGSCSRCKGFYNFICQFVFPKVLASQN